MTSLEQSEYRFVRSQSRYLVTVQVSMYVCLCGYVEEGGDGGGCGATVQLTVATINVVGFGVTRYDAKIVMTLRFVQPTDVNATVL